MLFIDEMKRLVHDNKYSRAYFNIVSRAKTRAVKRSSAKRLLGYVEGHHIVPQSINHAYKSDRDNIAFLTSREHFICHLLLTKCMIDPPHIRSMAFAFFKMFNVNHNQSERYTNSRFYAYANALNAKACVDRNAARQYAKGYKRPLAEATKIKIGESNRGSCAYYNEKTNKSIYLDAVEEAPEGFVRGVNPKFIAASNKVVRGSKYIHNPATGDEIRFVGNVAPQGFVEGRSYKFITDGVETRQINIVTDIIPVGWKLGRTLGSTKDKRRNASSSVVSTPFGVFNHKLTFCEMFNVDVSFFDNLNTKLRNRASNKKLTDALIALGLTLSMTKAEMGFAT